ncbi:hypothetical protein WAK64_18400 [Bacillus spongiae]|uniref:Uncharacterized protein n=1 Tax=Bacillus spongiae TaxID=2683610 RepID=A0ABU8HI05_9BACI
MSNNVRTSLSPAMSLTIIASILLLIFAILFRPQPTALSIFEKGTYHPYPLMEESVKSINIDEKINLNLVTDTSGNIYFYTIYNEQLSNYGLIANINDLEEEIYWNIYTDRTSSSGRWFVGIITNKDIETISVNNQNNIQYVNYNGYTLSYSTEPVEEPVVIKGFSNENNLIYENH